MEGGPSHIDLFDPKPELEKYAGQPIPPSFNPETLGVTGFGTAKNGLLPSKRDFKQHGKSGLWVSDWLPHIAQHVDDLAVIRSCWSERLNHVGGVCQMNTGDILAGRPSLGAGSPTAWAARKQNLPAFVVMQDDKEILGGVQNSGAGFLPATYQGTLFRQGDTPILNLKPPAGRHRRAAARQARIPEELNERYRARQAGRDRTGRAHRDPTSWPSRCRPRRRRRSTSAAKPRRRKKLYGMDEKETAVYGANCLLARRLVERGVRFVEVYSGSGASGMRTASSPPTTPRIAGPRTSRSPGCSRI